MAFTLKAKSLITNPNELSRAEGALDVADNVVIDRDDIIEPRRGFEHYSNGLGTLSDNPKQLMTYKDKIIAHYTTKVAFDSGLGTFIDFDGDFEELKDNLRIRSIEFGGNLYFTSVDGIKKISATSADDFTSDPGFITNAGGVKAIDLSATVLFSNSGFLPPESKVAYRVLWGTKDANNRLVLGSPSARFVLTNPKTSSTTSEKFSITVDDFSLLNTSAVDYILFNSSNLQYFMWFNIQADDSGNKPTFDGSVQSEDLKDNYVKIEALEIGSSDIEIQLDTYGNTGSPTGDTLNDILSEYNRTVPQSKKVTLVSGLGDFIPNSGITVTLVDGSDPITGDTVPQTAETIGRAPIEIDLSQETALTNTKVAEIIGNTIDGLLSFDVSVAGNKITMTSAEEGEEIDDASLGALFSEGAATLTIEEKGGVTEGQYANAELNVTIPEEVNTNYFIQVYRTRVATAVAGLDLNDIDPGEEFNLVYEEGVTEGQTEFIIEDIQSESFRDSGAPLYTNPLTGEGIINSNDRPPIATDIARFQNSAFYANTKRPHTTTTTLLSVTDFISGESTFTVGNEDVVREYEFQGATQSISVKTVDEQLSKQITEISISDPIELLNKSYITLYDEVGSVAFWIDLNDANGTEPNHGADRSIKVSGIFSNSTNIEAANTLYQVIISDLSFEGVENYGNGTFKVQTTEYEKKQVARSYVEGWGDRYATKPMGINDLPTETRDENALIVHHFDDSYLFYAKDNSGSQRYYKIYFDDINNIEYDYAWRIKRNIQKSAYSDTLYAFQATGNEGGEIIISTDRGTSWTAVSKPVLPKLNGDMATFISNSYSYSFGQHSIHPCDFGPDGTFYFFDNTDGKLYKSNDNGLTFDSGIEVPLSYTSPFATYTYVGIAVGSDGTIYFLKRRTEDYDTPEFAIERSFDGGLTTDGPTSAGSARIGRIMRLNNGLVVAGLKPPDFSTTHGYTILNAGVPKPPINIDIQFANIGDDNKIHGVFNYDDPEFYHSYSLDFQTSTKSRIPAFGSVYDLTPTPYILGRDRISYSIDEDNVATYEFNANTGVVWKRVDFDSGDGFYGQRLYRQFNESKLVMDESSNYFTDYGVDPTLTVQFSDYSIGTNDYIFLATGSGVVVTQDRFSSYITRDTNSGLGSNSCSGSFFDTSNDRLYIINSNGLSISDDFADTFSNLDLATYFNGVPSLNSIYAEGANIYVTSNSGIFVSTDSGNSFTQYTTLNGLLSNNVNHVIVYDSLVYLTYLDNSGYSTTSNFSSFNHVNVPSLGGVLKISTKDDNGIYFYNSFGVFYLDVANTTSTTLGKFNYFEDDFVIGVRVSSDKLYCFTGNAIYISNKDDKTSLDKKTPTYLLKGLVGISSEKMIVTLDNYTILYNNFIPSASSYLVSLNNELFTSPLSYDRLNSISNDDLRLFNTQGIIDLGGFSFFSGSPITSPNTFENNNSIIATSSYICFTDYNHPVGSSPVNNWNSNSYLTFDPNSTSTEITCYVYDRISKYVYIGTNNRGILRTSFIAPFNNGTLVYQDKSTITTNLPSNNIRDLFVDQAGTLYVATDVGISISTDNSDSFTNITDPDISDGVKKILVDSVGNIFTSDDNKKVLVLESNSSTFLETDTNIGDSLLNIIDDSIYVAQTSGQTLAERSILKVSSNKGVSFSTIDTVTYTPYQIISSNTGIQYCLSSDEYNDNPSYSPFLELQRRSSSLIASTTSLGSSETLGGKYFLINSASNERSYYVWFDTGIDGSSDPSLSNDLQGYSEVKVSIEPSSSAELVASSLAESLESTGDFVTTSNGDVVSIDWFKNGNSEPIQDFDTNFTFYKTQTIEVNKTKEELDGKYFYINSTNNDPEYYVWFYYLTGTDPLIVGKQGIQISLDSLDDTFTIASKIQDALNTIDVVESTAINNNVSVIWADFGPIDDIQDVDTGFIFSVNFDNNSILGIGEDVDNQIVLLSSLASAAQSIDETARSLVRVINRDPLSPVYAFYDSGANDLPGIIRLENRSLEDRAFFVGTTEEITSKFDPVMPKVYSISSISAENPTEITSINDHLLSTGEFVYIHSTDSIPSIQGKYEVTVTSPNTFTIPVQVTTAGTIGFWYRTTVESDNDAAENRLYYSKTNLPEAVPLLNYIDIGPKDEPIQRIIALRDSLFVLKTDGVYVVSGTTAPNFSSRLLDRSVQIYAPDTATVLNNRIYVLSTQGVVSISESGVSVVSRPIENKILEVVRSGANYQGLSFGLASESDRAYHLWLPTSATDDIATQCYRYNTFTRAWTRWTKSASCGVDNVAEDLLYLGSGDFNVVEVERKSGERYDYADRSFGLEIGSGGVSGTSVEVSSAADLEVGDAILQEVYVTIPKVRMLLKTLDIDSGFGFSTFFDDYAPSTGVDMRFVLNDINTKLVELDTSGTITAQTFVGSFENVRDQYNLMISQLNDPACVSTNKNYPSATDLVPYEVIIESVNKQSNFVNVNYEYPLIQGDITVYKAYECEVIYAAQHFGKPDTVKQVREATMMFDQSNFYKSYISFATDISPHFEEDDFPGRGRGDFGDLGFGASSWGGEGDETPSRSLIPRDKQRCRYIRVKLRHINAREEWAVVGVSFEPRLTSSRGYR